MAQHRGYGKQLKQFFNCNNFSSYGFTDEELDFIINYDIKYRMGSADAEGNGDE